MMTSSLMIFFVLVLSISGLIISIVSLVAILTIKYPRMTEDLRRGLLSKSGDRNRTGGSDNLTGRDPTTVARAKTKLVNAFKKRQKQEGEQGHVKVTAETVITAGADGDFLPKDQPASENST